MLRSTPRIEVNQRSREARLRLERAQRLIVGVMTRRSSLVPRTRGLELIWPRPNRQISLSDRR
jgi:hypothetical protein